MTPLMRAFEQAAAVFRLDVTWNPAGYYEDEKTLHCFGMFEAGKNFGLSQIPAQAGDAARTSSSQDRAVDLVGDAASCASPTLFDDAATRALR